MKPTKPSKKKVWEKPKLIVLDFKSTNGGAYPDVEVGNYHS